MAKYTLKNDEFAPCSDEVTVDFSGGFSIKQGDDFVWLGDMQTRELARLLVHHAGIDTTPEKPTDLHSIDFKVGLPHDFGGYDWSERSDFIEIQKDRFERVLREHLDDHF